MGSNSVSAFDVKCSDDNSTRSIYVGSIYVNFRLRVNSYYSRLYDYESHYIASL